MSGRSRWITALVAVGLAAGLTLVADPARAAMVGYVRLAHLSPDTPPVDVYLSSVSGGNVSQKFPAVGYGVVSKYLPLPVGTYSVAMRNVGTADSSPPVLSTQVTVTENGAYTVAGVGRFADLGLRVISDDLAKPSAGKAKVRVVQASVRAPLLDVSNSVGAAIATNVPFATTTAYREVDPGKWRIRLQPSGSGSTTEVAANCAAGGVYSVLVLDGKNGGLTIEVRTDARAGESMPTGGVDTGAGGTAPRRGGIEGWFVAAGAMLVTALVLLLLRRRRVGAPEGP